MSKFLSSQRHDHLGGLKLLETLLNDVTQSPTDTKSCINFSEISKKFPNKYF
jgi:hypothetical protein